MKNTQIAHRRDADQTEQSVLEHLQEVSAICGRLARKAGAEEAGRLLGLLHDFGKYSNDFQIYIQSATGMLNPDIDGEYVDAKALRGKIDHSTAGAQWIWQHFREYGPQGKLVGQMLAVCLASHHGGLLDCLKVDGKNGFQKRIGKEDTKTNLQECLQVADKESLNELHKFDDTATKNFLDDFFSLLLKIVAPEKKDSQTVQQARLGLFTRFLFSCLIDADRINSADFEDPAKAKARSGGAVDWQVAIERMEAKNASFSIRNEIDTVRREISEQCRKRAEDEQGIYTLTVPTGGGKTFASMRYALHHAKKHNLEHIVYIIPFTSIIEQNAEEIRKILEQEGDEFPWVLEHHSSLEPEELDWRTKLITENWDAPVIFTTMVQFLEVLFGGGTRGARRMHTLANSVLIFDEIQSLPVKCVHLFCNALQFLVNHAGTTAVLCTATQPLLNDLKNSDKGQLNIPAGHELVDNMTAVFEQLKRVEIKNQVRPKGWSEEEIAELALEELEEKGNCLVVVNTKKWAQKLYERCADEVDEGTIFHLSTSLCPAHRKEILAEVRERLDEDLPVLCISTQLIEAGVDVDFNSVIRFLAGLDSIAQAAGRCNRNGNLPTAEVFVVNPQDEQIDMLEDIKIGRDTALRIFSEEKYANLLDPEVMSRYFRYYFYERADLMPYPLNEKQAGRQDTLLSLLSDNQLNIGRTANSIMLQQSFKTAGRAFKAIDAPTQAVIVPYGKGKEIIADLCAEYEPSKAYDLLKQAQQYSVNVFPNVWRKLKEAQAVYPAREGEEIYCLYEQHYNKDFGLSTEVVGLMDLLNA
ncbi:MAG: CRISPR-associated helicase Cas3' [Candidatus Electrothrix communis]|nr:MAG: CRISPR-associated helicase Cas3' [Candidatus Electrothrix communis]